MQIGLALFFVIGFISLYEGAEHKEHAPMKIFVKNPMDKAIILEVDAYDTIESVKGKIQDKWFFKPTDQILLFNGKKLENERTLSDYDIKNLNNIRFEHVLAASKQSKEL